MKLIIPNLEATPEEPVQKSLLDMDVPPDGDKEFATLVMVGEAPSFMEMVDKKPFVGPAGDQLSRICGIIGIPRYSLYITNCVKTQLPKNDTNKLWTERGYRAPEWGELQDRLITELAETKSKFIILFGATAMMMLLDTPRIKKITNFRGTIFQSNDFPHLKDRLPNRLLCPVLHPASALPNNSPLNFYIIMNDLQKILDLMKIESQEEVLVKVTKEPVIKIQPTFDEAISFMAQVESEKPTIGFDIECTPTHITCFAIAYQKGTNIVSMCIPLMDNHGNYWTPDEELAIWTMLAIILGDGEIKKVCQNGMFDLMFVLRTMGIKSDGFYFDTMLAQHICWADLPKGLDFLTSVYTYHPYYKDEGKQIHLSAIKDYPVYWKYNAKDAAYTLEIMAPLKQELKDFEAEDALEYSMNLHKPLMEMEFNGILTDKDGIATHKIQLHRKIRSLQHGINKIAGKELNINSSKQLIAYFYGTCGIKPYVNRKTSSVTCDAVALSRIARKKGQGSAVARMIIKARKYSKLVGTYFEVDIDPDDHIRCAHKIAGTISGRISTEKTFFGTGMNLQNQPKFFKKFLIADPGHFFLEVDLKQAEAHCVAYLCQDANMINAFESGIDVHTFNASKIFNIPMESITKEQRSMGKKVVHARNYGMGPQTFSDNLAKEDIFMTQSECGALLDAYSKRFPGLDRWQKEIANTIYQTRRLHNMFGRPKRFLGMIDSNLLKSAFSYIPQSTVAELLNRGSIKLANDADFNKYPIKMCATVHDSNLFMIPITLKDQLLDIILSIKKCLSHEFIHKGRRFTIGMDAKVGYSWGKCFELKQLDAENVSKALAFLKL